MSGRSRGAAQAESMDVEVGAWPRGSSANTSMAESSILIGTVAVALAAHGRRQRFLGGAKAPLGKEL